MKQRSISIGVEMMRSCWPKMPVMDLYDESDFISNIKGDYRDKSYLEWSPIQWGKSKLVSPVVNKESKKPSSEPKKVEKTYARLARERRAGSEETFSQVFDSRMLVIQTTQWFNTCSSRKLYVLLLFRKSWWVCQNLVNLSRSHYILAERIGQWWDQLKQASKKRTTMIF